MKLQVKQLDERVCRLISNSLEMSSIIWEDLHPNLSTEAKQLATEFKHCIFLQVSEAYDSPHDDVQVLGKQEKGGEQWN